MQQRKFSWTFEVHLNFCIICNLHLLSNISLKSYRGCSKKSKVMCYVHCKFIRFTKIYGPTFSYIFVSKVHTSRTIHGEIYTDREIFTCRPMTYFCLALFCNLKSFLPCFICSRHYNRKNITKKEKNKQLICLRGSWSFCSRVTRAKDAILDLYHFRVYSTDRQTQVSK